MKYLFPSLCLAVLIGGVFAAVKVWLPRFDVWIAGRGKMNVLVVSSCSLRPDRIGIYNPEFKRSPLIDKWSQGAYIFTNAVAEEPWQNFSYEASEIIDRPFLAQQGYLVFGQRPTGFHFIVPPTETAGLHDEWFWSDDAILHYKESFSELKRAVLGGRQRPFYIFSHLKYMHYPYYDPVNMDEEDFARLSPKSRQLLERYVTRPLDFEAQLPVVSILLNNFDLLKKKFKIPEDQLVLSTAGVISDPKRTARWQKTAGYADDLTLVKELYDLKMEKFDEMASEVLNLYGHDKLKENTVVIFTGDHGEALMEHGVLGHSVNVYEEMLRYPLMVKFPGSKGGRIDQQVNHTVMAKLVAGLVTGDVNAENFEQKVKELNRDFLIARNCQDNIRTVRHRSEWKYIKDLVTGENELYNLKTDPGETINLVEREPDMAWKLEEYMIDHQSDFKRRSKREEFRRTCL